MRNSVVSLFLSSFVIFLPVYSFSIDFPRGPIILTLPGAIEQSHYEGKAVLDSSMLRSLPQGLIETDTPWTDGIVSFEGPLFGDVLALGGARGSIEKAKASNDYFVSIPVSDDSTTARKTRCRTSHHSRGSKTARGMSMFQ